MKTLRNLFVIFAAIFALALTGCDAFNFNPDTFIEENTAKVTIQPVKPMGTVGSETVRQGTDGYICVKGGSTAALEIPLSNAAGLGLDLTTATLSSSLSGGSVTLDGNTLKVNVPSKTEGTEGTVEIVITAENGRPLVTETLQIAYINFDVTLSALTVKSTSSTGSALPLSPTFGAFTVEYSIGTVNSHQMYVDPSPSNTTTAAVQIFSDSKTPTSWDAVNRLVSVKDGQHNFTVRITAPHGAAEKIYTVNYKGDAGLSDINNLTSLKVGNTNITTGLDGTGDYTYGSIITCDYAPSTIAVTAARQDDRAKITINVVAGSTAGTIYSTFTSGDTHSLTVGPNTITLQVEAQNGDKKFYTISVTRKGSNTLTDLDMKYDTGTTDHITWTDPALNAGSPLTHTIPYNKLSVTITATIPDTTATMTMQVNTGAAAALTPNTATSTTSYGTLVDGAGANTITIVVTASNGGGTKTYTITPTWAPNTDNVLTSLEITSPITWTATGLATTTAFTGPTVESSVSSVQVKAVAPAGASMTMAGPGGTPAALASNSATATNGTLATGTNTITIVVTPGTGSPKTYTITLGKKPAAPAAPAIANATTDNQLTVSWPALTDTNVTGYEYYLDDSTASAPAYETSGTSVTGRTATSATTSALTNGFIRKAWVRAVAGTIKGNWSPASGTAQAGVVTLSGLSSALSSAGTIYVAGNSGSTPNGTISLTSGLTANSGTSAAPITLLPVAGKQITLIRGGSHTGALITVGASGTLKLGDVSMSGGTLIIDGGTVWGTSTHSGYLDADAVTGKSGLTATSSAVEVSGTLTMYNGVTIQNNYNTSSAGGGTNSGGGVRILAGGNFTMAGGLIKNNCAENGGGIAINPLGTATQTLFTMTAGTIAGNLAYGNPVSSYRGGGVYSNSYSTAVVSGGASIEYNAVKAGASNIGSGWHAFSTTNCDLTGVTKTLIESTNIALDTSSGPSPAYNTGW